MENTQTSEPSLNDVLNSIMSELTRHNQILSSIVSHNESQRPVATPMPPTVNYNVPLSQPDQSSKHRFVQPTFSGEQGDPLKNNGGYGVDAFITDLEVYFEGTVTTSENMRLAIVHTSLKDTAKNWWMSLLQTTSRPTTWDQVRLHLVTRFDDGPAKRVRQNAFFSIEQGAQEAVAAYADRFRNLRTATTVDDIAATNTFLRGLRSRLRHHVLTHGAHTVERAVELAALLEQADAMERQRQPLINYEHTAMSAIPLGVDHMQVDAIRGRPFRSTGSSTSQRDRNYQNNACCYCHKSGHIAQRCPEKRGRAAVRMVSQVTPEQPLNTPSPTSYIVHEASIGAVKTPSIYSQLQYTGQVNDKNLCILVDCGATHSFVDASLAQCLGLEIRPLETPMEAVVGDKNITVIHHVTTAIIRTATSVISEKLFLFPGASFEVILGMPWLERVNPCIDWRAGSVN